MSMSELLIPEPQPGFPCEDVSEANARVFEQLMFEPRYIYEAHAFAEAHVTAFKIGHAAVISLGRVLYKDENHQRAFSFGATLYEAISTTVHPAERVLADNMHIRQKVGELLVYREDTATGIMHIMDESDRFSVQAPVAAQLVESAADLYPRLDKRIVMWGAALERSIDRDTLKPAA